MSIINITLTYMSLHVFLFQIVEAMPHSDTVQNFIAKLDSFYETVDAKTINGSSAKCIYKDAGMDTKALTEASAGERATKHAVSIHSISAAQCADIGSRSKRSVLNASKGEERLQYAIISDRI